MIFYKINNKDKKLAKQLNYKIKHQIGIKKIKNVEDLIKLQNFVFSLIPVTNHKYLIADKRPYFKSLKRVYKYIKTCKKLDYQGKTLPEINQFGGWCDINAYFMMLLLQKVYDFKQQDVNTYHYGYLEHSLAHTVCLVRFKGKKYLFDPYLAIIYIDPKTKSLLDFDTLSNRIKNKHYDNIEKHYSTDQTKPRQNGAVLKGNWWWNKEKPFEIEEIAYMSKKDTYKDAMLSEYGNTNLKNLIVRTHGKSHHCYKKFSVK